MLALKNLVDSKTSCKKHSLDRYKRSLSTCYNGDVDVNLEMIKQGWAVVYMSAPEEYVEAEIAAKNAKIGLWQVRFMRPELYRASNRQRRSRSKTNI